MIVLACATSAPDTATFSATDTKGNTYGIQSQNQVFDSNGVLGPITLLFLYVMNAIALTTADTITLTCDTRQQMILGGAYYTGSQGNFTAFDIEYNQGTALSYTVAAKAGQSLLSFITVHGPVADGFTQQTGWGVDLGNGLGNSGFSIHGGAKIASADGSVTYAPTLGKAQWSAGFLLAFT